MNASTSQSLRTLRFRGLAFSAAAAAGTFLLTLVLTGADLALGDLADRTVLAGMVAFGVGGILYPNLQGYFLSCLLWAFLCIVGQHPEPVAGQATLYASVVFFLLARFHYLPVLDPVLWPSYDRYVIDHPDVLWWLRDAPSMQQPNGRAGTDSSESAAATSRDTLDCGYYAQSLHTNAFAAGLDVNHFCGGVTGLPIECAGTNAYDDDSSGSDFYNDWHS
jgi:hypothetical protein